jgi:hypothetical protein
MNIITDNSHADYNAGNEKIFAISVLSKIIWKKKKSSSSIASWPLPVNWECWTSSGSGFTIEPTEDLCSVWISTWMIDWGAESTYSWACEWENWWDEVNCSATNDNIKEWIIWSKITTSWSWIVPVWVTKYKAELAWGGWAGGISGGNCYSWWAGWKWDKLITAEISTESWTSISYIVWTRWEGRGSYSNFSWSFASYATPQSWWNTSIDWSDIISKWGLWWEWWNGYYWNGSAWISQWNWLWWVWWVWWVKQWSNCSVSSWSWWTGWIIISYK